MFLIKKLCFFFFQLCESTYVAEHALLLASVHCLHNNEFNEDFILCKPLSTLTIGNEIFKILCNFF
jgi:hypothetical protein